MGQIAIVPIILFCLNPSHAVFKNVQLLGSLEENTLEFYNIFLHVAVNFLFLCYFSFDDLNLWFVDVRPAIALLTIQLVQVSINVLDKIAMVRLRFVIVHVILGVFLHDVDGRWLVAVKKLFFRQLQTFPAVALFFVLLGTRSGLSYFLYTDIFWFQHLFWFKIIKITTVHYNKQCNTYLMKIILQYATL